MTLKRARYQKGCLYRAKRRTGPPVWEFRWREAQADGSRVNRKLVIGTVEQYPSKGEATKAVETLMLRINQETLCVRPSSMQILVEHYSQKELADADDDKKTFSTKDTYRGYIRKWILPRWEAHRLDDVKAVAVEQWLANIPRARGTRAKIRNVMSALFRHAMRYEWIAQNPIALVRQSAKRETVPAVLEVEEIQRLLAVLDRRERTLVLLGVATGLRLGELLALQWRDVEFERLELNVIRSIVKQIVGPCKTEASQKPVPLDPFVAEQLLAWKKHTAFREPEDWVFASPQSRGRFPYWGQTLMRCYIRPAARRVGITKRLGWHTFRHTYSTLLKANGEDVKVVQELLRHASSRITLDTYTQAVTPAKRAAQSKVVSMIRSTARGPDSTCVPFRSHAKRSESP